MYTYLFHVSFRVLTVSLHQTNVNIYYFKKIYKLEVIYRNRKVAFIFFSVFEDINPGFKIFAPMFYVYFRFSIFNTRFHHFAFTNRARDWAVDFFKVLKSQIIEIRGSIEIKMKETWVAFASVFYQKLWNPQFYGHWNNACLKVQYYTNSRVYSIKSSDSPQR